MIRKHKKIKSTIYGELSVRIAGDSPGKEESLAENMKGRATENTVPVPDDPTAAMSPDRSGSRTVNKHRESTLDMDGKGGPEGKKKRSFQEIAEARREQLKQITDRLEAGLKEYMTTDEQFKKVLDTMAKFHHYSANNVLLIAMQMPTATHVASYTSWQKKFKRQVMKGQHGLSIIMPAPYKKKREQEVLDPQTGKAVLHKDGTPVMEEVEVTIPRYKVAKVFDLSQTKGEPLPELDVPELTGTVENYGIFMDAMRAVSPVPIRFADIEGGAKGYYDNANKEIVIKNDMSELQTMKTVIHEVSHARLHDRDVMRNEGVMKDQQTREVEAESIAYVVLSHYHLEDAASEYSIPYLASWSGSRDTAVLRASIDTIRKTASEIFDEVEAYIAERDVDRYTIYQIEKDTPADEYCFMDLAIARSTGIPLAMDYYQDVYHGYLRPEDSLESLYVKFNRDDRPAPDTMHSLSVSDVVVLHQSGQDRAYYVDAVGFTEIPEFFVPAHEQKENAAKENAAERTADTGRLAEVPENSKNKTGYRQDPATVSKEESDPVSGPSLTFFVAECMEFPVMGEYHSGLTLAEAVRILKDIPDDRMHGVKGIGFTLQDGSDYAGDFPLVSGGHVLEESINEIPHYRDHPAVQEAMKQAKVLFPDHVTEAGISTDMPGKDENSRPRIGANVTDRSAGKRRDSVLSALREHQKKVQSTNVNRPEHTRTAHRQKGGPEL